MRASHIFSATLRCTIAGCTTKGDIFLYPDMKLVIEHSTNIVQQRKKQHDSFKSRKITGSQREALKKSLLDCPFPSKEYHKNLSQLDDCNFNAGNICDIGNNKNVYKQIKHESLKKSRNTRIRFSVFEAKRRIFQKVGMSRNKGVYSIL